MERFLWMQQLKKDPVQKKIIQTKDTFVDNDDFDPEEATEAAVDKRKFLIKKILILKKKITVSLRTAMIDKYSKNACYIFFVMFNKFMYTYKYLSLVLFLT